MQRHRHGDLIGFLNAVEDAVAAGKLVHVILDNYDSHEYPRVRAWPTFHRRRNLRLTPTSVSWLNAIPGIFSVLIHRRPQRGTFTGVVDLQLVI